MKTLTISLLIVAFVFAPMVAGASGDFQEGKKDGKVAAQRDFEEGTTSSISEQTGVPNWRMERISNRSNEYVRGFRSGYLERWENLNQGTIYAMYAMGIVVGLAALGLVYLFS